MTDFNFVILNFYPPIKLKTFQLGAILGTSSSSSIHDAMKNLGNAFRCCQS